MPARSPGAHEKFEIDYKKWPKEHPRLDLRPASFQAWHLRAVRWLGGGLTEVENLLELVVKEPAEISATREVELAQSVGLVFPISVVSRAIADAIVYTGTDEVAHLAQSLGLGRGLELYRHLHAEYKGSGDLLAQQRVARLIAPQRCGNSGALRQALIDMRELIREVELAGHPLSDLQRVMALKGLLPLPMLHDLENLEDRLYPTYREKEAWVRKRVENEHVRDLLAANDRRRGLGELQGGASQQQQQQSDDHQHYQDHEQQQQFINEENGPLLGVLEGLLAAVKGNKKGLGKGMGGRKGLGATKGQGRDGQRPPGKGQGFKGAGGGGA